MNVSGGLKKIRQHKNELKRKIKMRKENFFVIIPKGGKIEDISNNENFVEFDKISEEIKALAEKISVLREKIMNNNIQTIVTVENNDIT